jgi:alkyl hydroperoxide reductase subunit AhpC
MASAADLINSPAPDFALPLVGGGGRLVLSDVRGQVTVLHFWSAECPWSRRADLIITYRRLAWERLNIRVVGVACSPSEPEGEIKNEMALRQIKYPVVADYAQDISNTYRVQSTPTFVVMDRRGVVRYIGAIDDATAGHRVPKIIYLDKALEAAAQGQAASPAVTPAYGSALVRRSLGS